MAYREMKRQPRAKAMLPAIKELITIRALEDREKDRTLLAHELREEIQKRFPQEIAPTAETLIKKISEARNHATDPLDGPWHLGILNKLDDYGMPYISADGIEAILKIQDWLSSIRGQAFVDVLVKKKKKPKHKYAFFSILFGILSIRQAKWISALYRSTGNDLEYLWLVSFYYTYSEIISNISDTPFDTRLIDMYLTLGKAKFIDIFITAMRMGTTNFGEESEQALNILGKAGKEQVRNILGITGKPKGEE